MLWRNAGEWATALLAQSAVPEIAAEAFDRWILHAAFGTQVCRNRHKIFYQPGCRSRISSGASAHPSGAPQLVERRGSRDRAGMVNEVRIAWPMVIVRRC